MKKIFPVVAVSVLIAALAFLNYNSPDKKTPQAIIGNHIFNLAIAKTDREKAIGLAKYKNIPQNFGILFPFEKPDYYAFWMKGMRFPIDIIYIKQNKIVDIHENIQPPKSDNEQLPIIKPKETSDMVLEINANLSDKYNFKIGDLVEINY